MNLASNRDLLAIAAGRYNTMDNGLSDLYIEVWNVPQNHLIQTIMVGDLNQADMIFDGDTITIDGLHFKVNTEN
jgi:hypothetical protein